jgi:AmmeMemoRadiSam system protein A
VTLKIGGQLRGCIGNLSPVSSVWDGVRENAINAAFHDSRFSPLAEEELARIEIDISILTNSQPLDYNDGNDLQKKLRPHIDGVILSDGYRSATFLPQVWDQLPDATSFLDHLCLKAGLPRGAWQQKKLDIRIYQVQSFAEEE